jgi:D-methionine transport system ATP-binding protein
MIRLENVNKTYEIGGNAVQALKNINLDVKAKSIFGVVGKSGAGKSTLLRCVNLLERPTTGRVYIATQELTAMSPSKLREERRKIGMIFQHFNLLDSRTVWQNIAFPLHLEKASKQKITARIDELLHIVGLTERADAYPAQLSGGQKQRVAIARALATEPDVLLCDEATSSLDPQTTNAILKLLMDINTRLGITILLITHQMEVIKQICDEVAVLNKGEIIEQNTTREFFANPQTDIAKELVKSCLKEDLPQALQEKISPVKILHGKPILRIFFHGASASKPLISHLVRELNLEINILQANIEVIREDTMGIMLVEISADESDLQKAMQYLQSHGITVEVIGYVSRTI